MVSRPARPELLGEQCRLEASVIRSSDLREHLDPELFEGDGPQGAVYLWQDRPVAELHLFSAEYSFFWPAELHVEYANDFLSRAMDEASQRLSARGYRRGNLSLSGFLMTGGVRQSLSKTPSRSDFDAMIRAHSQSDTTAVHLFAQLDARWELQLWADTPGCPGLREVGITTNLPLPLAATHDIFEASSSLDVPPDDLADLLRNVVEPRTMEVFSRVMSSLG